MSDTTTSMHRASLLPAFEPLSSSPGPSLPVSNKRKFDGQDDADYVRHFYPTPVPTSSTGLLPSSPQHNVATRPSLQRDVSTLSERAPLGTVPSLTLHANGAPVHMGRSSNSSDYQLSANRLISRVHVRAVYHAPTDSRPQGEVVVECLGWNGCRLHVGGQVVELVKEDSYRLDNPAAQIIVDVQDTRVQLLWPQTERAPAGVMSSSPLLGLCSPVKRRAIDPEVFASSPPVRAFLHSPSISPARPIRLTNSFSETFRDDDSAVRVYEDAVTSNEPQRCTTPKPSGTDLELAISAPTTPVPVAAARLPEIGVGKETFIEHDEENNPAVQAQHHPMLLPEFEDLSPTSPKQSLMPIEELASPAKLKSSSNDCSPQRSPLRADVLSPITNHVINQLAFSRVHAVPISAILANLPADIKTRQSDMGGPVWSLTEAELKHVLDEIPCVGEISREGKDAAGKRLENEFYYLPDMDSMESRRATVSVGRPPIRNVRKQHKQYYWKKPRA